MIYYEIAYQFLLENPNTIFYDLPLELMAKIMEFLNQLNFQWNKKSAKVVLDYHFRNLIPQNYKRLRIMDWETQWVCHNLPRFVVTLDSEFYENNTVFVKELNIRRKKSTLGGFWNMRSRIGEKNLDDKPYLKQFVKNKYIWRKEFKMGVTAVVYSF